MSCHYHLRFTKKENKKNLMTPKPILLVFPFLSYFHSEFSIKQSFLIISLMNGCPVLSVKIIFLD